MKMAHVRYSFYIHVVNFRSQRLYWIYLFSLSVSVRTHIRILYIMIYIVKPVYNDPLYRLQKLVVAVTLWEQYLS